MFKNNKSLLAVSVIAIVNALGYGIIIPILYSYSRKFGLNDFQNGLLFATFSLFQFLATPLIGRLSDQYGRKPLLLISLAGTMISFLMMAFAPSAVFLFLARALDGITAGNIPVASAVISDTTEHKDRARGFGIIGASFGFGFIFGPAISALTLGFGLSVPFLVAASMTFIAILLTWFILPETNKNIGQVAHGQLIDLRKLARAVVDKNVGMTLLVSLLYSFAFSLFIFAYQPVSVRVLHLSPTQISESFTVFGIMGLVSQLLIIPRITKKFGDRKTLSLSLSFGVVSFALLFFSRSFAWFITVSLLHSLVNGFVAPVISSLLSKEVDAKSQGEILGVNSSYVSLGMIFGPIAGGIVATIAIPAPFLFGSLVVFTCLLISLRILAKSKLGAVAL